MRRVIALLSTSWVLGTSGSLQAQPITLHYQERPPYSGTEADGRVTGLVANPAAAAVRRAGIEFRWALTPSQRQLALIQSGSGRHCGVGWFRTDERAARGQFSAPLYQDQPLAALVRNDAIASMPTSAAELLNNRTLRLLVKDGYSYGPRLDQLIAQAPRVPLRTSVEPLQMSRMVLSGRADWMIVAPEEAEVLSRRGLSLTLLTDAPTGPLRYLYCSADVPAEWMLRIDAALREQRR